MKRWAILGAAVVLAAGSADADEVLDVAERYANGGGYHWTPGNSGSPVTLTHRGQVVLPKGEGSFCCGYTLAVVFEVAQQRGLLDNKTFEQLKRFQRDWYGDGPNSRETLVVKAVERLGIGCRVEHADAQPGDFVQLWRTSGSGHSVVLLDWVREGGEIVGLRYRSSQKSTDGIGDRTEYFADAEGKGGSVVRQRTYVCRLDAPPANDRDHTMEEANRLVDAGQYAEAEEALRALIPDPTAPVASEAAIALERIRRTRREFSLTEEELLAEVRRQVPDADESDLARWRDAGDLQLRVIDGKTRYFRRAASNLFRFNSDAARRREKQDQRQGFDQTGLIARLVAMSGNADGPAIYPVKHHVTYTLTVKPNNPHAAKGATVRAWLPYPQEYQQQRNVKLIRSAPAEHQIAPPRQGHRTIYLEQEVVDPAKPLSFVAEYEFVTHAWAPRLNPAMVLEYDKIGELYTTYTAERAPHIVLDDPTRRLAAEIVGDEPNPLIRARKIFRWVSANIPWCAEMEYSIIDSLGQKGLSAGRGDCGVQGTVFITLCRAAGVPARWQSGWQTKPGEENMHDWSEFYVEPWGWLPADASHGVRKHADPRVQDFLCGGLDPYRMIVNLDYAQELHPPKTSYRSEPNDFQRGEVEIDGHNLYFDEWNWDFDVHTEPLEPSPAQE
ncbi:Transglutaminase-like superfamily protein [Posidoniimonas corsicana]|uniref:Transglutaminase-like superfamily protein n=1 Tax=Posidoniimonas corsicana TaxID=1938618 RepID=A0A5C5VK57_9BACT|nr:transglutaminase-like domain-containing protein [Posidoniimonas corsicana]TWT38205.1 Transglutaminase-like superfamily protein [Posidoniimonas corsicana]